MAKKGIKLNDIFDLYIKSEVIVAGLSRSTAENYNNSKRLALKFFGDIPVRKITVELAREYYGYVADSHAPKTTQGHMICLRSIIKFARKQGVKVIDFEDIKIPKVKSQSIRYLTEEEAELFASIISSPRRGYSRLNRLRNVAMFWVLFRSGIRVSELCRLNIGDIKNCEFVVTGKSRSPRVCYITLAVHQLIQDYIRVRNDSSPALFIANQTGERITPQIVQKVFRTACANSDFQNVTPHTMRHSYATNLLNNGADIRHISEFLGHENLETTKIYTHVSNPNLREIYERIHGKLYINVLTKS